MKLNSNLPVKKEYQTEFSTFCKDVVDGLSAKHKYLNSKYFYDANGDRIFQEIMNCPEYYLSRCEMEILKNQANDIAKKLMQNFQQFDLIELGPGNASKSIHLLRALQEASADFCYTPIDISENIITHLEETIPKQVKNSKVKGMTGDFLEMLKKHTEENNAPKVILFLGSSIGNMNDEDALSFCKTIYHSININDLLLIGFDLKKNPKTILNAYNDKGGITKEFNLNLLTRINRELGADFNIDNFTHLPSYNPQSGVCKSFLISKKKHSVFIQQANITIDFTENEAIFMEKSVKYSLNKTEKLAQKANFSVENHFFDNKKWFVDSLWKKTNML